MSSQRHQTNNSPVSTSSENTVKDDTPQRQSLQSNPLQPTSRFLGIFSMFQMRMTTSERPPTIDTTTTTQHDHIDHSHHAKHSKACTSIHSNQLLDPTTAT